MVVLATALSACATAQPGGSSPVAFASDVTSPATAAAASAASAAVIDTSVDYKIGAMDVIDVAVFQVPDLSATVQVSESGQVTLPLLGQVTAAGKTTIQLQTEIAAKLGAKYLQSPQVTVSVKEMLSQRVTVEGAVNKPGIYPTNGKTTLLQMIAVAGGLNETAETRGIIVLRTIDGQRQAAKFDYVAIRGGNSADPVLKADDVVVVDDSGLKTAWKDLRNSLPVFGFFRPFLG
jgi:polysaccharide export outer membrane protein